MGGQEVQAARRARVALQRVQLAGLGLDEVEGNLSGKAFTRDERFHPGPGGGMFNVSEGHRRPLPRGELRRIGGVRHHAAPVGQAIGAHRPPSDVGLRHPRRGRRGPHLGQRCLSLRRN